MKKWIAGLLCVCLFLTGFPIVRAEGYKPFAPESAAQDLESLGIQGMSDSEFAGYLEEAVYHQLVGALSDEGYFIEKIEATYVSEEYWTELIANSRQNVYFGFSAATLKEMFQDQPYYFTVDENGQTVVRAFEKDDTNYLQALGNIAVGAGIILITVTVSALTAGSAPVLSFVLATSAKTATGLALSSGAISAAIAGGIEYHNTGDVNEALKQAALQGSESFKWGAVIGAGAGAAYQSGSILLAKKGTGLLATDVVRLQKELGIPLDVLGQLENPAQAEVLLNSGLQASSAAGRSVLVPKINPNAVDPKTGLTNLQLMKDGYAAIDASGVPYELHHMKQNVEGTLAVLTQNQHRLGDSYKLWHNSQVTEGVHSLSKDWDKVRKNVWKGIADLVETYPNQFALVTP